MAWLLFGFLAVLLIPSTTAYATTQPRTPATLGASVPRPATGHMPPASERRPHPSTTSRSAWAAPGPICKPPATAARAGQHLPGGTTLTPTNPTTPTTTSGLPFTGFNSDAIILVGIGLLLFGAIMLTLTPPTPRAHVALGDPEKDDLA